MSTMWAEPVNRFFRALALAALSALAPLHAAFAADAPGSKDFPSISRFKGAEIADYQAVEFDEALLPVKPVDGTPPAASLLKVEGKVTSITYLIPKGKSPLEVMRNYEQALGSGFKTVFACAGTECGKDMAGYIGNSGKVVPTGWGHMSFDTDKNRYLLAQRSGPAGDVYVLLYAMQETNYPTTVFQKTVEIKPMQGAQVTVLDAAALQRGLDAEGKVAVYGSDAPRPSPARSPRSTRSTRSGWWRAASPRSRRWRATRTRRVGRAIAASSWSCSDDAVARLTRAGSSRPRPRSLCWLDRHDEEIARDPNPARHERHHVAHGPRRRRQPLARSRRRRARDRLVVEARGPVPRRRLHAAAASCRSRVDRR